MSDLSASPDQRERADRERSLRVDVVLVGLMTALMVLQMTWGKPFMEIPGFMEGRSHFTRSLDLEFFNGFDHPTRWWAPWTNTLGNIAMFFPVGIAGYYLTHSRWATVLLAALYSVIIEAGQYFFVVGFSDVDDLACNTLGAAIGAVMVSMLNRKHQQSLMNVLVPALGAALMFLFGALILGLVMG